MKDKIYSEICKIVLEQKGRPIPSGILMQKTKDALNLDYRNVIYNCIDDLIRLNKLKKLSSGNIVEGYINTKLTGKRYVGTLSINSSIDGYVRILDENNDIKKEIYINNINLNNAITGDIVEVETMQDKLTKSGIEHGIITKVIEHNTNYVVGEFKLIGKFYDVVLDDSRIYHKVKLQDIDNLVNGHKILIKIAEFKDGIIYGSVDRILGHVNDPGIDILSILVSHGIESEFSQESINQANNCKINPNDNQGIRRDITDRLIVTIDPATSKDLDDAIYVKKNNDYFFLSVSIADVSHYVTYESPLWNEAVNRSTSIYLVDKVIPMLPHYLSNNICSLNMGEPRLCLTCDMEIDKNGNYSNIDVYPSVINSKKRFSYDEVNEFFDGKTSFGNELDQMLSDAKELHNILRKKKYKEGYIDFDIKEPKIVLDDKGWPIDILIRERGIAQKMIEDFMICANEGVSIKSNELNIPFLYRIHNKPKIERLEMFAIEAKKLGFITSKSDFENMEPKTIARWLKQNENNPNINLISKLLLRCMQKAEYSIKNIGHFGLSIKNYTHFTSPIRRTSDMVIHLLFWMFLFDKNNYTDQQRQKLKNDLDKICKSCTSKEITAIEIEREVNQLKFCQYMSKKIGEMFNGTISTIKPFGIFVELDNTIEVLVRINSIGKDYWKYQDSTNIILGSRSGKHFTFGQKIQVKITNVNIREKQINAYIVGYEPENDKDNFRDNKRN